MRIAIIGVGRLGAIIAKALSEHHEVILVDHHPEDLVVLASDVGAKATDDLSVVKFVDLAVIAVKPSQVEALVKKLPQTNIVVSCAAGIPLKKFESWGVKNIIRIMPNICAEVNQAVIAYTLHPETERREKVFLTAFTALGMCIKVEESHMDAITSTSGAGPAFMAYFAQAMVEEAVKHGMAEEDAELVVAQTLIGTGTLMKSGWTTKKILDTVVSPGGVTEAGLKMLDEKGANTAIHNAIRKATERAKEIGK